MTAHFWGQGVKWQVTVNKASRENCWGIFVFILLWVRHISDGRWLFGMEISKENRCLLPRGVSSIIITKAGPSLNVSRCFELKQILSPYLFPSHSVSPTVASRSQKCPPLPLKLFLFFQTSKKSYSWLHAILKRYYAFAHRDFLFLSNCSWDTPNSFQISVLFNIILRIQSLFSWLPQNNSESVLNTSLILK